MRGEHHEYAIDADTVTKSLDGTMAFPEIVTLLSVDGVERYHADLVRMEKTFYMPDGTTHVEKMPIGPMAIGETFATLRTWWRRFGTVKRQDRNTPTFCAGPRQRGSTDYIVYLQGRKAIYFGRKGDYHIEVFPGAK